MDKTGKTILVGACLISSLHSAFGLYGTYKKRQEEDMLCDKYLKALKELENNPNPTLQQSDNVDQMFREMGVRNILRLDDENRRVWDITAEKIVKQNGYRQTK